MKHWIIVAVFFALPVYGDYSSDDFKRDKANLVSLQLSLQGLCSTHPSARACAQSDSIARLLQQAHQGFVSCQDTPTDNAGETTSPETGKQLSPSTTRPQKNLRKSI